MRIHWHMQQLQRRLLLRSKDIPFVNGCGNDGPVNRYLDGIAGIDAICAYDLLYGDVNHWSDMVPIEDVGSQGRLIVLGTVEKNVKRQPIDAGILAANHSGHFHQRTLTMPLACWGRIGNERQRPLIRTPLVVLASRYPCMSA